MPWEPHGIGNSSSEMDRWNRQVVIDERDGAMKIGVVTVRESEFPVNGGLVEKIA